MTKELAGQVTLVTGGSRGIGRAVVGLLAAAGGDVILYRADETAAKQVVADIERAGGHAWAIQCDLAAPGAMRRPLRRGRRAAGRGR